MEHRRLESKHKDFIAHFESLAVDAMGLDWARIRMKEDPEEIAGQVAMLVKGEYNLLLLFTAIFPHEPFRPCSGRQTHFSARPDSLRKSEQKA